MLDNFCVFSRPLADVTQEVQRDQHPEDKINVLKLLMFVRLLQYFLRNLRDIDLKTLYQSFNRLRKRLFRLARDDSVAWIERVPFNDLQCVDQNEHSEGVIELLQRLLLCDQTLYVLTKLVRQIFDSSVDLGVGLGEYTVCLHSQHNQKARYGDKYVFKQRTSTRKS